MDHLLVMPLTPFQIAMAKVWANGLIIAIAVFLSLEFVVQGLLHVPISGSVPLFMLGVCLYLFFATAIGIFLATVAHHAAAWPPLHACGDADEHPLWLEHTARQPTGLAAHHQAGVAFDAFRLLCPGHSLSGSGISRCGHASSPSP
jgi:hypothetical protein